jgi:iron complex outermembrane receptor protein
LVLCAAISVCASSTFAQAEQPQTWAQDIAFMGKLAPAEAAAQQSTILQIRANVELWIKAHPEGKLELAPLPHLPLGADQAVNQVKELNRVVAEIIKLDPTHPFHLGIAQVNVTASISGLMPITDSVDQTEIAKRSITNVAAAMDNLPGVSVEHNYSGRNQEEVYVHGFNYLQVPLYIDGIPMNVPYDGTMDFRRIQTSDIAEIQVDKGFSSALMGPNTVGGAINVVTKEPQKKYEGEMLMGGFSGDGFLSSIRLGSRISHYFAEGSMDWLQNDYVPLSGNFVTNALQTNDTLNHSNAQDAKYSGRFGWTPKGENEYVFSYNNQKANEGIPLNTGNDPLTGTGCGTGATASSCYVKSSYRSWGYWDKTSYYFHSNTAVGENSSIKVRAFYDQYPNRMLFYTGLPYSSATLNTTKGYITSYDDHSDGASAEFNTRLVKKNAISGSFLFKDDTHKTIPLYPYATGPASDSDRQQTVSIGLQDVVTITAKLTATIGFSADHLDGLRASDDQTYYAFVSPECASNTDKENFSACTPHLWAYNPQISIAYSFKDSGKLFGGFSQKNRFPGMKEMYSYKLNSGLPNPNLKTEHSQNWEIGYSRVFAKNTSAQVEFFRSDLKDAIESVPVPSASNTCGNSTYTCTMDENATKEIHEGVELAVRTIPLPRLTFDANYTYLDKKIDGFNLSANLSDDYPCGGGYMLTGTGSNVTYTTIANNTCLTATDVPKHKAVVAGTLRLPREATLNADIRYESGTKAVDDFKKSGNYYYEIVPMSNFATMGLGGTMPLYKGATLQAGVKNLFDRNYYYVLGYPEEGRNWFVNMRYRF